MIGDWVLEIIEEQISREIKEKENKDSYRYNR